MNTLQFNRRELLLKELKTITKDEVLKTFDDIFINNPRKISLQILAGNTTLKINDINEDYYLNKNIKTLITTDMKSFSSLPIINQNLNLVKKNRKNLKK